MVLSCCIVSWTTTTILLPLLFLILVVIIMRKWLHFICTHASLLFRGRAMSVRVHLHKSKPAETEKRWTLILHPSPHCLKGGKHFSSDLISCKFSPRFSLKEKKDSKGTHNAPLYLLGYMAYLYGRWGSASRNSSFIITVVITVQG